MKTVGQILEKNSSQFQKLLTAVQQTEVYDRLLKNCLDAELAEHCHFAAIKDQQITVVVDNSAWATRFRYAIPDILKNLNAQLEFKDITKIRYIIEKHVKNTPKKVNKEKMSAQNERLWKETVTSLSKQRSEE